jgi:hypothetical protein
MPVGAQDEDCYRWNNAPDILCYQCNSCKAGVMEQIRQDWHKIAVLDVIVLAALICICACGCCAFRNARRSLSEYPYGVNQMSKINPRWDYYWYSKQNSSVVYSLLSHLAPLSRKIDFITENVKIYRQKDKVRKLMEHKQSHEQKKTSIIMKLFIKDKRDSFLLYRYIHHNYNYSFAVYIYIYIYIYISQLLSLFVFYGF